MFQLKSKSSVSGKQLAIGVLGLASVAVMVIAVDKFDINATEVSGTIAPAQRFVSDQIGTGDVLDESPGSATKGGSVESTLENSMASSMESSMENSMESSMESSLESSMESALSSSLTSNMARDECQTDCSVSDPITF
jgi:hypothetical protein